MERKPDHHERAQEAIIVAENMYECVRLVARTVFARLPIVKAHANAIVLIRENGGMQRFPALRKFGRIDWTMADLSGIIV